MKTIDITVDLETCSLCPTAAVMSIGAVAWDRYGEDTPFIPDERVSDVDTTFSAHIDLRGMFVDGFTFDQDTANWWAKQSEEAKKEVVSDSASFIEEAVLSLFRFIENVKKQLGADDVCLWSQGSDFDIAILRNICYKYGIEIPVRYTNFRDHRTFFLEGARIIYDVAGEEFDSKKAYALIEKYEGEGAPHDPVFDCKRSIFSTWQMMKHLKCINKK